MGFSSSEGFLSAGNVRLPMPKGDVDPRREFLEIMGNFVIKGMCDYLLSRSGACVRLIAYSTLLWLLFPAVEWYGSRLLKTWDQTRALLATQGR